MAVDLNKLSTGDRVIGISGIVLFVFSFFKWFGYGGELAEAAEAAGVSTGENAWGFTLPLLAVIIGLAMVVLVSLKLFDVNLPDTGNLSWGQILLGMGAVAFLFVLIKAIVGVDTEGVDVDIDRKIGLFVGVVASAGLAVGGYLRFQETGSSGPSATPPPPPPTA